jgi:hypothetical protein
MPAEHGLLVWRYYIAMTTISTLFKRTLSTGLALALPLLALAAPDDDPGLPPYPVIGYSETDIARNINTAIWLGDGSVLLGGGMFDASGPTSWGWMLKADGSGKRIWEKELGKKAKSAHLAAASAMVGNTTGDGALLVGTVNEITEMGGFVHASAWIVAVTADGRVQWDKSFTFGALTRAHYVEPTQNGSFLVLGSVREPGKNDRAWIVRIDGTGRVGLQKNLDVPKDFAPTAFTVMSDGSFLVGGKVIMPPKEDIRGWIGRFGADGKPQWSHTLALKGAQVDAAKVAADGAIVLALTTGQDKPVNMMRLNAAGETLQAPVKTGLCKLPALWRNRNGDLQLAGVNCAAGKVPASLGLVADLAHPERLQQLEALPGGEVMLLAPQPERNVLGVLGERRSGNKTSSVFVTRALP